MKKTDVDDGPAWLGEGQLKVEWMHPRMWDGGGGLWRTELSQDETETSVNNGEGQAVRLKRGKRGGKGKSGCITVGDIRKWNGEEKLERNSEFRCEVQVVDAGMEYSGSPRQSGSCCCRSCGRSQSTAVGKSGKAMTTDYNWH